MSHQVFENEDMFHDVLDCLEESGAVSDVVLIGSWAELCYQESGLLGPSFTPLLKTMDVDLLIPRMDGRKRNFIALAKERGFIYIEDKLTGYSSLFGKDDFEVEFLTPQVGDGTRPLPRSSVGVNAQQLTHLSTLVKFTCSATIHGIEVRVPSPEAYVVQKLVVNDRRKRKAKADREKVANMLPHLDKGDFLNVYSSLTKKEQRMASATASLMGFADFEDLIAGVGAFGLVNDSEQASDALNDHHICAGPKLKLSNRHLP